MNRTSAWAIALASVCSASAAHADATSLFTASIGASLNLGQAGDPGQAAAFQASPQLELRVRLLRALAFEVGVRPFDALPAEGSLVYTSRFRWSGILYLLPLDDFGMYAKAGLGGADIEDMFTFSSATNSYHFGGGLEIYLNEHFAIGSEVLFLLPGARSVVDKMMRDQVIPEIGDLVNPRNFQVSLGARFYL
jgi:hypothetical protein